MKQQTKYYSEFWYKLEYQVDETRVLFKAWKITGLDEGDLINSDIEDEHTIDGYIKWDGCMEFHQKEHYCGIHHAKQTLGLIEEIYKIGESCL